MNRNQVWLTLREVSVALGIHINTATRISPSELSYMKIGKRGDRRYKIEDVETYIERHTVR